MRVAAVVVPSHALTTAPLIGRRFGSIHLVDRHRASDVQFLRTPHTLLVTFGG
jgi:hypothetical protein